MPFIRIISQDGKIKNFNLSQLKVAIGRSQENDIVLDDTGVSRHHAEINREDERFIIKDIGSVNGVFLGEEKVESAELKHGDRVRIGSFSLVYMEAEAKGGRESAAPAVSVDDDYKDWAQKTISVSPDDLCNTDFSKLPLPKAKLKKEKKHRLSFSRRQEEGEPQSLIGSLERANKALFVLYEVSRQLNSMKSVNEILAEMMNLLFKVIDADFGFLILTDHQWEQDLSPLVVKYRDDKKGSKEIKASRSIIKKVIEDKVALLTSNAQEDSRFEATESLVKQNIRSAMCVPLWQKEQIIGVIQLDSIRLHNQFTEDDLELLKTIGCQMAIILEQASLMDKLRNEERLRNKLQRFHSPQVIEMILHSDQETQEDIMEAKELDATVLFTDIVGFTPLSEKMKPKEINRLLNDHFSMMTDIIFEKDGTLDKYTGDGLMAVFGAPFGRDDDAERAVAAALRMKKSIEKSQKEDSDGKELKIRIGLNTGIITAGNIGSPKRMDYTVLGDTVNVASRLESIAHPNQILIGEETYLRVKNKFKIKEVGLMKLKGKSQDQKVYEVLG